MSTRLGSALADAYQAPHERVRKRQRIHPGRRGSRVRRGGHGPGVGRAPCPSSPSSRPSPIASASTRCATCPAPTCATADTHGVVLVMCDGEQVPDRQSLNLFESVSPSVLLDSAEGMGMLSQQAPAVDLDGPARAVREAINQASAATRPSAIAVASYLDQLAAGDDPLAALPVLGAFTDTVPAGGRVDSDRIGDNLALASTPHQRRSAEGIRLRRPAATRRAGAQAPPGPFVA